MSRLNDLRRSIRNMTPTELIEKTRQLRADRRKVTPRTKKKLDAVAGVKKPKDETAALKKMIAKLTPEQRKQLLGE